jgi:type IV pilus assembly protein PilW
MNWHTHHSVHARKHGPIMQGRSLIELLVAMVIGLIVLGGIMLATASSTLSGSNSSTQSQLNEDAQTALSILVPQLRMAGFSTPITSSTGTYQLFDGPAVRGCDNGFVNADVAGWNPTNATQPHSSHLTCNAGADGATSLSVMYEADVFNTPSNAAGVPTDCLGRALPAVPSAIGGSDVFVAENRFFLSRDRATDPWTLNCQGNGAVAGNNVRSEQLINNIETLQITYGVVAGQVNNDTDLLMLGNSVVRYMTQQAIDAENTFDAGTERVNDRWRRVASARLCITVRAAVPEPGADAPFPYEDCSGAWITPADADDRFLRKTVHATVALRNVSNPSLSANGTWLEVEP